ncbi:unnamed protein product [Ixodes pacificus]
MPSSTRLTLPRHLTFALPPFPACNHTCNTNFDLRIDPVSGNPQPFRKPTERQATSTTRETWDCFRTYWPGKQAQTFPAE